ncbi:MAG: aminomethyltransferase family protein [Pseudomonadota bacterium]
MRKDHYKSAVEETPFHRRTAAANHTNLWGRWAGFTTVSCYEEVEREYFAIRNAATLFDLSPMIKYKVTGPEAEAYLNRLVTRDISKLPVGRVAYCLWCDDEGKVLDDGTLFRLSQDDFRLCCQERNLPWLQDAAFGFDVDVEDISSQIAALALQGPTSASVLRALGVSEIDDLRPFNFTQAFFAGGTLLISRTGFTGDLGYELWVDPLLAEALWDRLMEVGAPLGLRPIGSQALDIVRLEAGFIVTNVDFVAANQAVRRNRGRSPFELGLGRLVDLKKGHFNGRRALLRDSKEGPKHNLVLLDIQGNKAAEGAIIYHRKSREVGHVTSAHWSPTCKTNLAFASLQAPYGSEITDDIWAQVYTLKELKWDKVMASCQIVPRPYFNSVRRQVTPPGDW